MSNLTENEKLFNSYRFTLAFVIDKAEKVTFLISGKGDIPDFLSKEMEIILTRKDIEPDKVYRPFHRDVGETKIPDNHPAKAVFADERSKLTGDYLGDYEKITFTPDFLSTLSKSEKKVLDNLYYREHFSLRNFHLWHYLQKEPPELTLSADKIKRFFLLLMNNNLLFKKEKEFKKKVVTLPGIGEKTAFILWEIVSKQEGETNLFHSGGTSNYLHSNDLIFERDSYEDKKETSLFLKVREEGKQLDLAREREEKKENSTITEVSGVVEKKEKDETSDDSSKQDETKESRGITRNPFLWMIAIAIVVWWKWDEIQGYIS